MSVMTKNIKAIRVGEKIMVFINGEKKVVSQKVSPEIFNVILELIKNNEQEKIGNIFSSFDEKVKDYLGDLYDIKQNSIFLKDTGEEVLYSKLILRKALEMLSLDESPQPLIKLSKKIEIKHKIQQNGKVIFQNVKKLIITKNGNLIFHTLFREEERNKTFFGTPISPNNYENHSFNIPVVFDDFSEPNTYVLVNPFDIVSFAYTAINVTRFKILKSVDVENKCVVDIKNEDVFDIPYEIFLLKNKEKL